MSAKSIRLCGAKVVNYFELSKFLLKVCALGFKGK